MGVREEMLESLGGAQPRFTWLSVDGWMFARGGKWHFFRANGLELLSLCRRHAFKGHQDLARSGYKSAAACVDCRKMYWALVERGELPRPE